MTYQELKRNAVDGLVVECNRSVNVYRIFSDLRDPCLDNTTRSSRTICESARCIWYESLVSVYFCGDGKPGEGKEMLEM